MWVAGLLTVVCVAAGGGLADDSLRSALEAVQRKQRDQLYPPAIYSRQPLLYGDGQPEDIGYGYQKTIPGTAGVFEPIAYPYSELGANYDSASLALEKLLLDDLEKGATKRSIFRERGDSAEALQRLYDQEEEEEGPILIPSPFRERMSEKARLQNAHSLVHNYARLNREPEDHYGEGDEYLNVLNSIWEKYRNEEDPEEISEADVEEILDYLSKKEERKRQYGGNYDTGYDFFNSPLAWNKRSKPQGHFKRYQETLFDERYPYKGYQKRYPITKRSPAAPLPYPATHRHKKSATEKQNDPKVAAELNNIFASEKEPKTHSEVSTTMSPNTTKTAANGQKELTQDNSSLKPLEVKKKSVKWSDYFGIDRRKKSTSPNEINNEWLLNQYLEAYGMGKDRDQIGVEKKRPDDVENKMRAMEDLIVDQAIKYTGAHEGATDSKEIQEVKDKVMAQLAAAYSLEKMRRALGEFKASIAAQKATAPASHSIPLPTIGDQQSKRLSMKKEKPEPSGKMEKKGNRVLSNEVSQADRHSKECPVLEEIERGCKQIATIVGDKSEIFLPLCNVHHICYLCGGGSTRDCDVAFLKEAEQVCHGEEEIGCFYLARRTLAGARSLRPDPGLPCDWPSNPCLSQYLPLLSSQKR